MLVPSTFTGWYRKMMKNAETASEMNTSRTQRARAEWEAIACDGGPVD